MQIRGQLACILKCRPADDTFIFVSRHNTNDSSWKKYLRIVHRCSWHRSMCICKWALLYRQVLRHRLLADCYRLSDEDWWHLLHYYGSEGWTVVLLVFSGDVWEHLPQIGNVPEGQDSWCPSKGLVVSWSVDAKWRAARATQWCWLRCIFKGDYQSPKGRAALNLSKIVNLFVAYPISPPVRLLLLTFWINNRLTEQLNEIDHVVKHALRKIKLIYNGYTIEDFMLMYFNNISISTPLIEMNSNQCICQPMIPCTCWYTF